MSNLKTAVSHKVFSLRKDVKIKRLGTLWAAAYAMLVLVGVQIITFNSAFYSDIIRPDTIGLEWFNSVFTSMVVGFPLMALSFIAYHSVKKDSVITDNTYNVLRLTAFTLMASTSLIAVLEPVIFGTFLPFIFGDFSTFGAGEIPVGYAMTFPTLFIVLVMPAPILGVCLSTIKTDWIKVSFETYTKTRNWFVASTALSMFLLPVTVSGQGIWMLDATGLNKTNWQSNMFFAVQLGGQVGLFITWVLSMTNEKVSAKLASYKKYARIKNQYLALMATIIVAGSGIWLFDKFIIQNLYPPVVASLGIKIPQDMIFAVITLGDWPISGNPIELPLPAWFINDILGAYAKQQSGITMGNGHWYYWLSFSASIISIAVPTGFPVIDYLFFKEKGKFIK